MYKKFLTALVLLASQALSGTQDYDIAYDSAEDHIYEDYTTPEEDRMNRYKADKTVNKIQVYHSALVALIGSDDQVKDGIYGILHQVSFWRLAEVKVRINAATSDPAKIAKLSATKHEDIRSVMAIIDKRMAELSELSENKFLFNQLTNYSTGLLSVLSAHAVYDHLEDISRTVVENHGRCPSSDNFLSVWEDLLSCDDPVVNSTECRNHTHSDFIKATYSLAGISQAVNNATQSHPDDKFFDNSKMLLQSKATLVHVLSERINHNFVTKTLGSWEKVEDMMHYILCHRPSLDMVENILLRLSGGANSNDNSIPQRKPNLADADDVLALVRVQHAISQVTTGLTMNPNVRRWVQEPNRNVVGLILDSYMDLVDDTVSSTDAWSKMSLDEAEEHLYQLLLSNEKYVGMVSDVIFTKHQHQNLTIQKDSISINMYQMVLAENSTANAHFRYDDLIIWTDDMAHLRQENDSNDIEVFTLRYKSWSHMMLDILLKHNGYGAIQPSNDSLLTTTARTSTLSSDTDTPSTVISSDYEFFDNEKYFHPRLSRQIRSADDEDHVIAKKAKFNKTSGKGFIGKGGIISLSAHHGAKKASVAVTYWIRFSEENRKLAGVFGGSSHRCFSCEYLDDETVEWKSRGCDVLNVSESGITCRCNHTTNFAAFMMPAELISATKTERKILEIMSTVGSILSVIGLVLSLVVFAIVRNLVRNERLKAHVHLALSLLAVHMLNLLGDIFLRWGGLCVAATVFAHYCLLASFMWMLVEGIFLYLYVVQVFLRSKISTYSWMYLLGWLLPAIIVVVSAAYGIPNHAYVMPYQGTMASNETPTIRCPDGAFPFPAEVEAEEFEMNDPQYERCFLSTKSGMIWSFLAPALFVLVFNTFIMWKTLQVCIKSFKSASRLRALNKIVARSALSSHSHAASMRHGYVSDRSTDGHMNSDTYDQLHGQAYSRLPQDVKYRDGHPQIVVSNSPCLLQVTTDEENEETGNRSPGSPNARLSLPDAEPACVNRRYSSSENLRSGNYGRNQAISGEFSEFASSAFNRESMVYRNSACITLPMGSMVTPMINNPVADFAVTERRIFFHEAKTAVKGAIVLLPVLGVPWICGVLSHLSPVLALIFVFLNSTQGLAIFIVYCVFNGEVKRAIERRFEVRRAHNAVDAGVRRRSSTSTTPMRSFLRFGRRRSTVTTSM